MLTLKAPLQLHIDQSLTGQAEAFSQRILGNYALLGTHFAAKDLLFAVTAPPELPEGLGGMTTLINQQNSVDLRDVTVEVMNSVINRILLDGTEQFTYQDQVYITEALNQLGITDVAQFMNEVRQLRVENERIFQMTRLYQQELTQLLQRQSAGESVPALPLPGPETEEAAPQPADPRVTMCMEILNRLHTAQLYERVHAFQRSWSGGANVFRAQELKLSEQLRFGTAVTLEELKQQIYQQPQLHLTHHINAYETGELLEAPRDEESVLTQTAAAVLMSAVDNTVVEVLNRPQIQHQQWIQVQNALWQTAENTLSRFSAYHSAPPQTENRTERTEETWNRYAQELKAYQLFFRQIHPAAELLSGRSPEYREPQQRVWLHLPQKTLQAETLLQRERLFREVGVDRTSTHEWSRLLPPQLLYRPLFPGQEVPPPSASTLMEENWNLTRIDRSRREGDLIHRWQEGDTIEERDRLAFQMETNLLPVERLWPPRATARNASFRWERIYREGERVVQREAAAQPLPPPHWKPAEPVFPEERRLPLPADGPLEAPAAPVVLTPREAQEQAPELLRQEMTRIDQHNRTILQTVERESRTKPAPPPAGMDIQRTLRDSLRALEEPEALLQELSSQKREPVSEIHRERTAREEALVRQAEPKDRALYEAVLAYQKDPEGTLKRGLLRPESLGTLHAALQGAEQEQTAPPMEHPVKQDRQQIVLREQSEALLERLCRMPERRTVLEEPAEPPQALKIVHKQAPPDVTQELIEQLQTQRTQTELHAQTHEEIHRRQDRQVEINETERKVVAQSTEDLTELINRTLARQMRTLSDQVYRQMEKRLQAERSRRGRL